MQQAQNHRLAFTPDASSPSVDTRLNTSSSNSLARLLCLSAETVAGVPLPPQPPNTGVMHGAERQSFGVNGHLGQLLAAGFSPEDAVALLRAQGTQALMLTTPPQDMGAPGLSAGMPTTAAAQQASPFLLDSASLLPWQVAQQPSSQQFILSSAASQPSMDTGTTNPFGSSSTIVLPNQTYVLGGVPEGTVVLADPGTVGSVAEEISSGPNTDPGTTPGALASGSGATPGPQDPSALVPGMSSSLYVRNLPPDADELFLYQRFARYGAILSCRVHADPVTGRCRGVGFVNFSTQADALRAQAALHGTRTPSGHKLHISLQVPRAVRNNRSSSNNNGGGNVSASLAIPSSPAAGNSLPQGLAALTAANHASNTTSTDIAGWF